MRYDDVMSHLRLWYPELTSIIDKFFTLLLSVGPLWTGLLSVWLSLAKSRHTLTLSFGFHMRIKLLHHSAISSMAKGFIMSCCWSISNSSLNSFCSPYVTYLGVLGMVYCLA